MNIASYIDHTLLKPTATAAEIDALCAEALRYGFAAVCVPPCYVRQAADRLQGSPQRTATVIGFPFGYSVAEAKATETRQAMADGAGELDMVINLAALKSGNWALLEAEIAAIAPLTGGEGRTLKVIVESGLLSEEEIIRCCDLYARYQVQFLKTSTGYAEKGASVDAVALMRRHLPPGIGIKASGGIRSYAFARELVDAGATRIGCSAGVQIVEQSIQATS